MKNLNKLQNRNNNQSIQTTVKNCRVAITLVCALAISSLAHAQWTRIAPNVFTTTATDKVSIGATVAETKLYVNDPTPVTTFTGASNAGLRIHSFNSPSNNYALIGFSGFSSAYTRNLAQIGANFSNSGSSLYFGTSNNYATGITNTAMTINPAGNVGIGTTTPGARLEVRDGNGLTVSNTTTSAVLTINRANAIAGSSNQISFQDNGSTKWALGGTNIGSAGVNNFSFYNYSLGANALTISNLNNNVGIGTTTPVTKLHIASPSANVATFDAPSSMFLTLAENGIPKGYIGSYSGGVDDVDFGTYGSNSTGAVNLTIQDIPKITIARSGNVGIGTTTPGYLLDVAGRMRIRSGGFTSGTWFMNTANTVDAAFVGMLNDNYVGLYGNGIGWGFIMNTGTGNIGMGTFNPAYKLDVCGTIRAKEVRVETGWCDYVFADDYKLPALNDVESYIKKNRHLPGVTKGSEIETEGLEVGKVSSQMIRKIEELTLYIIDLQKQVDALKSRK